MVQLALATNQNGLRPYVKNFVDRLLTTPAAHSVNAYEETVVFCYTTLCTRCVFSDFLLAIKQEL